MKILSALVILMFTGVTYAIPSTEKLMSSSKDACRINCEGVYDYCFFYSTQSDQECYEAYSSCITGCQALFLNLKSHKAHGVASKIKNQGKHDP